MEVRWDWDGRAKVPAPLTDGALAKKKEKERDKKVRGCTSAAAAAAKKQSLLFPTRRARERQTRVRSPLFSSPSVTQHQASRRL